MENNTALIELNKTMKTFNLTDELRGQESRVGLTFILAIFGAITVLFTGNYPKDIFKLVVGMNRWGYRVVAYASLMTDQYPPFRLWDE